MVTSTVFVSTEEAEPDCVHQETVGRHKEIWQVQEVFAGERMHVLILISSGCFKQVSTADVTAR